ncbi:MAG: hypothetical protein H8E44_39240 [Planctomycetes bacterium]|nr:hypothetical protein [Planctomycetota bacterium]
MSAQQGSSIRFECSSCGGRVKVPPGQAGQKCQCPKCSAEIVAPGEADQQPARSGQVIEDDFFAEDFVAQPAPAPIQAPTQTQSQEKAQYRAEPDAPPAQESPASQPSESKTSRQAPRKSSSAVAQTQQQEFGIECWLCGTRMYATLDQVGKKVKCPDCHSMVMVNVPKKPPEPTQHREREDQDEFGLSEPVERPPNEYLPREELAPDSVDSPASAKPAPEEASSPRPTGNAMVDMARGVMAKAEAEVEAEERARPKLPEQPFKTDVLSFLLDAAGAARWVVLTLMGHAFVASLHGAFALAGGGGMQQFLAVFLSVIVIGLGVAFALLASACSIAIVQDTTNGYDKIEQWPGVNIGEWMFDGFYVINSLLAAVAPGALPVYLLSSNETAIYAGTLTGVALFPILLLSAFEQASPLGFASPAIWKSLGARTSRWLKFYLLSAGLAVLGVGAGWLMATDSFFLWGLSTAILSAIAMVYFRLLGRLAWCLSEENAPATTTDAKTSDTKPADSDSQR